MQKQLLLGWQFLVLCCDGPWGNGFRLGEGRWGLELFREAFRDPFQLRPFCDSAVVFFSCSIRHVVPLPLHPNPRFHPVDPPPCWQRCSIPFLPFRGIPQLLNGVTPPPPPNRGVSCLLTQSSPPSPPTSPPPALILTKCPFTLPSTSSPRALPSGPKPLTTTTPPPPAPIPSSRASIGEAPCPFVPHSVTR